MKKLVLATLVTASLGVSQLVSAAQSGVVNIYGRVVQTTCVLSPNDENKVIVLDNAPTNALDTSGKTYGKRPFYISVEKCGASDEVTQGGVKFLLDANVDANGRLINQYAKAGATTQKSANPVVGESANIDDSSSSAASNVVVELLKSDGTPIKINGESNSVEFVNLSKGSSVTDATNDNTTKLRLYAQYYATGTATAGGVYAKANFEIAYK